MGGGGTQTTTSSTAPANPAVTATQSKLLGGLNTAFDKGVDPFNKSLYAGVGPTTQNSWAQSLGAAGNEDFSTGVGGAIADFGDVAAGNRFGLNDPGYARIRQGVIDDTMTNINSQFTNSGRFGGGSHVESLGEGVGNAVAGLDYGNFQQDVARQQQAMQILPQAFQASLMPSVATGAVGAAQDADKQAGLLAENDLFRRQNDTEWDALGRASSILAGTAPVGGQTTTQTSPATPWWQQILGAGAIGSGIYKNIWGQ